MAFVLTTLGLVKLLGVVGGGGLLLGGILGYQQSQKDDLSMIALGIIALVIIIIFMNR